MAEPLGRAKPTIARSAKALGGGAGHSSGRCSGSSSKSNASGIGQGKGPRPGRKDAVSQLLNTPDETGDTAAVVAAVVNLYDDQAARLRQCQAGAEARVLPLKRKRKLETAEEGSRRCLAEGCSCKLRYSALALRLSTTRIKVCAHACLITRLLSLTHLLASARSTPYEPLTDYGLHPFYPWHTSLSALAHLAFSDPLSLLLHRPPRRYASW